jgi:hypothetical protein
MAELREQSQNIISRSSDAAVVLTDTTVSRSPHAVLRFEGDRFVLEHLRPGVTLSRVNEVVIDGPTRLSDGDTLGIGDVRLLFLDLAGADKRAAFTPCSNPKCRRRNNIDRTDCWFCGENLANAESAVYDVTRVEFRVVASGESRYDLFEGEHFGVTQDGIGSVVEGSFPDADTAGVEMSEASPRLRVGPPNSILLFNGQVAVDKTPVRTGDRLGVGGMEFLFIVR